MNPKATPQMAVMIANLKPEISRPAANDLFYIK
jgi:hypothetical protein